MDSNFIIQCALNNPIFPKQRINSHLMALLMYMHQLDVMHSKQVGWADLPMTTRDGKLNLLPVYRVHSTPNIKIYQEKCLFEEKLLKSYLQNHTILYLLTQYKRKNFNHEPVANAYFVLPKTLNEFCQIFTCSRHHNRIITHNGGENCVIMPLTL
jgi:hypothetical protein